MTLDPQSSALSYPEKPNSCRNHACLGWRFGYVGSMAEWIPVTERLPEWGQLVIVAYNVACGPPDREVGAECHYADGVWTGCDKMKRGQPTHWMPLPELPTE